MGAPTRLFSVAPSTPFLETLVETLVDGSLVPGFCPADDPALLPGATLYLPTRRAARLLPELFLKKFGGKPVLLPTVRPVGDTDEDLQGLTGDFDLEPLPPAMPLLERHLAMTRLVMAWKGLLRREALSLRSDEPLGVPASTADAAWLAGNLLSLMDEVETEEADWTELSDLVPEDHARYWQITLDFLKIVQEAWPAHLAERDQMDPKARRSALIRREAERLRAEKPRGPVIVAGVTGSVPATAELLKVVAGLDQGVIVLPGLDPYLDDRSWQALGARAPQPKSTHRPGFRKSAALPSHPQYSLKQLLDRLGVQRSDVALLGGKPGTELALREELVSEALRPADTSDNWTGYLDRVPEAQRALALKNVSTLTARNEAEEALSVAVVLRETVERGETAALVSPDRMLTRRVAAELGRWNVQVDDSAGKPLDQTAPAILSILAAKLAFNGCDPIDLLALLKHPLTRLGLAIKDVRSAARALERGVLRGPRAHPGTEGLKAAIKASRQEADKAHTPRWKKIHEGDWEVIEDLVNRLSEALAPLEGLAGRAGDMPVTELARRHVAVVQAIAVDEAGSVAELYAGEAGDALAQFFSGLLDADGCGLDMPPAEWPTVLSPLMSGHAVRRRLPGDPRIQILGPMEARLQSFDLVIMGGLNEGIWPQRTRNDPWLNRPMKQDIGLEPPERRLGAAAHDFAQGLGCKRVLLSRPARADGAPTVASRWLQRLTTLAGPEISRAMEARGSEYLSIAARLDRDTGPVRPAKRPEPRPPLQARPISLSVTEIERLIRDPYAIYARHVLELQQVDPIGGEPGAADKGNLVHDALALFLANWTGPFDDSAVAALTDIGEELFEPLDAFPAIRALWWPRFQRIAAGFVAYEAERAHHVDRRFLEIGGGVELALPGIPFRLRGRADRIDQMSDGRLTVIDYKTGQVPSQKQVDALLAPQLPLEAAMVKRSGFKEVPATAAFSELLYLQLKGGAEPLLEVSRNPKETPLDDLIEDAWSRLEQLIAHYAQEETGYLSRARVLRERQSAGPYDHLARVQEWALGSEDS
ncbi:MAG: double-strand break repair protein AddB [Roseibium sp.]|uniref:double-strand break repair protein AddB n=1 Tax=Roseibium sp. TaxID=1936156 RepID=UPI001B09F44A|nr:double-strand break repair protein AddB [Roseibium sp.]MBO6891730.1 double-strand break repair protein AddB [Roseibium sp.]MBO6930575.1 double-strand break repair protein AddB [Roseibium sp.]